jgi:N-methylhydantoinase B
VIDPVTVAVIRGSLEQVCDEMDAAMIAAAVSPVIADGRDRGSGLYNSSTGELIAQGNDGVPLFVAVMQTAVRAVLEHVDEMADGDVFIVNDPYRGGTHLMDVKMVRPIFVDGRLLALVGNMGHWADIGGAVPGGYSTSAREVYAEGLQIPIIRLVRAGVLQSDIRDLILQNIRQPAERAGDIEAQLGALEIGRRRFTEIVERWGADLTLDVAQELRTRSAQQARTYVASIPNGRYVCEDYLDSDGVDATPLRVHLTLDVEETRMRFDFSESAPACKGPLNCPLPVTISSCLIAIKHLFPEAMLNAGFFEPFEFVVPETSFLNAQPPRPVAGSSAEVSQRIVDVVFGALAEALPELVPAASYSTACNMAVAGSDARFGNYVCYLYTGGGYGGSPVGDGLTNGPGTISIAAHPGIEFYEQRAPILFRRFAIREDSAGSGEHRGGFGVVREFELRRGDAIVSVMGERGRCPAFGVHGGLSGATTRVTFIRGGTAYQPPHVTKDERIELSAGDLVVVETPGGGGWGDPRERSRAAVAADIARGYFTEPYLQTNYPDQTNAVESLSA